MADEDISEWQEIPSPSSIATNNNNNTQIADVEITSLPLTERTIDNNEEKVTEITTLPLTESTIDYNEEKVTDGNKWLKKNLRELRCWVFQIGSKMRNYATGIGIFTSNTSRTLTLLLVSLFYWMIQEKWRRQKQIDSTSNKLMLLLQQKDQKIKQLSLQISQMNECLQTRRKVPVLQVG